MNVEYPDLLGSVWLTPSDYCQVEILRPVWQDLFHFLTKWFSYIY